jgi:hexosaminidase
MTKAAVVLGVAAVSFSAGPAVFGGTSNELAVIPQPEHVALQAGAFQLPARLGPPGQNPGAAKILVDPTAEETGRFLANELHRTTGGEFPVVPAADEKPGPAQILLTIKGADPGLGDEGYTLEVAPGGVVIRARGAAGLFYGAQSMLQLLPPDAGGPAVPIPCVQIRDRPRFKWRGMMLDVSRHFFTKPEVEQLLDAMARYKLNRFHWHLVDDQGWRVEIKKYPRLTEAGAWRQSVGFGLDPKSAAAYGPDGRYGGYYKQDDIREVVAYAQARHIVIVPEIEMPGHSSAALMVRPELSCTGGPFTTDLPGGVFNGVYCAGNESSFAFVEDVLGEVFELFPGPYVHIGGDEVPTNNWKNCPKCQARMKAEGLTKEIELESYFIRRIEKFVNAHHRRLIGWSEIREGGLAESATIMDWVGGATEAAQAGHDVVMCPLADCYFDHYQSQDHSTEPRAIGGYLPLRQVYAFEPIPAELDPRLASHILGAQANVWTEYMPSLKHVEYMVFPRLCALSEVVWSAKSARNWPDFDRRLQEHHARLDQLGITFRREAIRGGEMDGPK